MDNKMIILQCAKELFYLKGYDAVGVQEIVDRAGVTKPTLYYHFGSKLGLLKTLMEMNFSHLQGLIEKISVPGLRIEEVLYQLADAYCEFFERDRQFYMLMMSLFYSARENEAHQVVRPYVIKFYSMVVKTFEQASDQLGNMHGRQKEFALGFIGTINHYLLQLCESDTENKVKIDKEKIQALVNQFMYGIFS